MKLYFAPMTCSLSPHIVLRELGLPFELIRVNNKTKATADGHDFRDINPKGYVAALVLDNGQVLTEGPAIVQYLADQVPGNSLAPANGTWERIRLQELLNFITSEIHGGSAPLFNVDIPEPTKEIFRQKLFKRLDYLNNGLMNKDYLLGDFGLADAYLFTVLKWLPFFNIDIEKWPKLESFMNRIETRPSVRAAIAAEEAPQPV
ncbi:MULTISPECIES: glutathione transferase GstA [unclassified Pseudomonas]|uniref:glutathione transferase GstA n=1 Tax=unclassified Pseudomonas TaxID=196821 RepID=UPI0011A4D806|nr:MULTISPECIES: glutathione transferase GstA [unclassified Pseudomonas]TWC11772.1 glutathione S-transferase [Pseudomonas sp. SJZ075]TWC28446.1 glutathione S-transferase [Pseudomonas sp. SJZ078]TWC48345.1 glutathione S-transferase [Pseudomonas sp. SJZ124]TWC83589.1 glutathione S-transferase [Pseudomonas sp. SJZ101]